MTNSRNFIVLAVLLMVILASCAEPAKKPAGKYTDIKGFFESEASRLRKKRAIVDKTVRRNEVSETKHGLSVNWKNELALFIESDINKPAWHDSYKVTGDSSSISYIALDNDLRTRSIEIHKGPDGRLLEISIINETKNNLYKSFESLKYITDSTYMINKTQDVLLLGNNRYTITGILR